MASAAPATGQPPQVQGAPQVPDVPPVGQQPNIPLLANSFSIAAQEMHFLGNLPSIAQGQAFADMTQGIRDIQASIATLTTTVTALDTRLTNSVAALNTRVDTLTTTVTALDTRVDTLTTSVTDLNTRMDAGMTDLRTDLTNRMDAALHNSIAISKNAWLRQPDQDFTPLRDLTTNQNVPNFPQTLGDLESMNSASLTTLLQDLRQPTTGTVAQKVWRVKRAIGYAL